MPSDSKRLQLAGLRVQQPDLDDLVIQQVLGVVQDVGLEQLDPLLDRHVEQFVGSQVGQLDARLVDGGQLLLLQHLGGHVADGDDQVLRRAVGLEQRSRVDADSSGYRWIAASNCCAKPVAKAV